MKMEKIRHSAFVGILLAASFPAFALQATPIPTPTPSTPDAIPTREVCAVLYGTDGSMELPDTHVVDLADGAAFTLPAQAPAGVNTVLCKRDSVIPLRNDFRVLLAGYVFVISTEDRVGALERANGIFRFRMMRGELTAAEQKLVNQYLADAKRKVDAEAAARK